MSKGKSFVVRISEDKLNKFNEILANESINRSALFRRWIDEYIDKHKEKPNK